MEEGINVKTNNKMLKFIVKPKASGLLGNAALKKKSPQWSLGGRRSGRDRHNIQDVRG